MRNQVLIIKKVILMAMYMMLIESLTACGTTEDQPASVLKPISSTIKSSVVDIVYEKKIK